MSVSFRVFSIFFALLVWYIAPAGAEEGLLLKGGVSSSDAEQQALLDAENSRHDAAEGALDSAERGLDLAHENKVKAIEEQDSDVKSIQIADENDKHERQKKDLERRRALEQKKHAERVGKIMEAAGELGQKAVASAERVRRQSSPGAAPVKSTAQGKTTQPPASATAPPPPHVNAPALSPAPLPAPRNNASERPTAQPRPASSASARAAAPANDASSSPAIEKWSDKTIPGRMMKVAERMDRLATKMQNDAMAAGNEFFGGMADSLGRSAKFLAQKPGTVLPQMADAVVTYLTNDYNENNQAMYDDAVKAVDELQKNPARFFGEHAVDAAMSAAGGATQMAKARAAAAASKLAAAEKVGMDRLKKMQARQAKKLEEAAKTLEGMAEDGQKFGRFKFNVGGGAPDYDKLFPKEPGTTKGGVNIARTLGKDAAKTAGKNNCFSVALAAAKRWRTGRPYVALDHNVHMPAKNPFTGELLYEDGKRVYGDVKTDGDTVAKVLKREYGGRRTKYPYHNGLDGLRDAREGIAVVSNQKKIEAAIRTGGKKSQGLVFVDAGEGTDGHVFNVRNNGGNIEFWDFQSEPPLQIVSFRDGHVVFKRGEQTVAVALEWKRVLFYRLD